MEARRILCVGARSSSSIICDHLRAAGWEVFHAADLRSACQLLAKHGFPVGLLVGSGLTEAACAELDSFLCSSGSLEWVGMFDAASVRLPTGRDLILAHLFDHHILPLDLPRLEASLGQACGRAQLRRSGEPIDIAREDSSVIGQSPAIVELLHQAKRIARTDAPVLIHGESGSGKELVAQAVHQHSRRAKQPFVAINCGAIQPSLIQSELFGHEKGSFTGAVSERRGFFEEANGGTVFLDEVGDLPLDLQVNLLRFLQEGTIHRVGSTRLLRLDVRVVAATHVDLEKAVAAGRFRQDLYYRLNVLPLHVAPLRERREDIRLLAEHFFRKFAAEKNPKVRGFSQQAFHAMEAHGWPGNVRELINRVRCSMIMARGRLITPTDLGIDCPIDSGSQNVLDEARQQAERRAIDSSLEQTGHKVAVAARQLGVSRMTLYRLMAKHGLSATH